MNSDFSFNEKRKSILSDYYVSASNLYGEPAIDSIKMGLSSNDNQLYNIFNQLQTFVNAKSEISIPSIQHFVNAQSAPRISSTYSFANIRMPANGYLSSKSECIDILKSSILNNALDTIKTVNLSANSIDGINFIENARQFLTQFIQKNADQKIKASSYVQFLKELSYILSNIRKVNATAYVKYNQYLQRISFRFCSRCAIPYTPAYWVLSPTESPGDAYHHKNYEDDIYHFAIMQSPMTTTHVAGIAKRKIMLDVAKKNYNDSRAIPLIYASSFKSDTPTFNVDDDAGTNGVQKFFKRITYDTYNVVDHFDIEELFCLKKGEIVTYQQFFSALLFIFEQWRNNLKNVNIEIYVCHYNCHGNSTTKLIEFNGAAPILVGDMTDSITDEGITPEEDEDEGPSYIMFVIRYKNFKTLPVLLLDGTYTQLGNLAIHVYEENFNPPVARYNTAADWQGLGDGGGNSVVENMLTAIDMTTKYSIGKSDNNKEKNKPYIYPLTINYPILKSTDGDTDYQINMSLQISSLHNDYYYQIMELADDHKWQLNGWVHTLQFGFLTADQFAANNTPEQIQDIKDKGTLHSSSLSSFAYDGINLSNVFSLQSYVSERNQTEIYIMNDMIIDALSIHNGRIGSLLAGYESQILDPNFAWPPPGKQEFTSNDWEDDYSSIYVKTNGKDTDEHYPNGIRKKHADKVAPKAMVTAAFQYVKEYADNLEMQLSDFIGRCLPHGQILIVPTSASLAVSIESVVKLKQDVAGILADFRGLNYISCMLLSNIDSAPDVDITQDVQGNFYAESFITYTTTVYNNIDNTQTFEDYIRKSVDGIDSLVGVQLNYSIHTSNYSNYVESYTYKNTLSDGQPSAPDLTAVKFEHVDEWKTDLVNAINGFSQLKAKIEVVGSNNSKFYGEVSFPIVVDKKSLSAYNLPTQLDLSGVEISIGDNYEQFAQNLTQALSDVVDFKKLVDTQNRKYHLVFGVDYALNVSSSEYDEISSALVGVDEITVGAFKITTCPTYEAQQFLLSKSVQTVLKDVKFKR